MKKINQKILILFLVLNYFHIKDGSAALDKLVCPQLTKMFVILSDLKGHAFQMEDTAQYTSLKNKSIKIENWFNKKMESEIFKSKFGVYQKNLFALKKHINERHQRNILNEVTFFQNEIRRYFKPSCSTN